MRQATHGQNKIITFSNDKNAYYNQTISDETLPKGFRFFEAKINEITLYPDATFEFWSRPNVSCFTWKSYKGNWEKKNDTLILNDNYQVEETNTKATYKNNSRQEFQITFKNDKGTVLKNKSIKIDYIYDYDAHLENVEKIFSLDVNNSIIISFNDVPNFDKLTALGTAYLLNYNDKRNIYLTENQSINRKEKNIPNLIEVELIENPKKEIVYRTTKAIVENNILKIVATAKTKIFLPDNIREILFEESYGFNK